MYRHTVPRVPEAPSNITSDVRHFTTSVLSGSGSRSASVRARFVIDWNVIHHDNVGLSYKIQKCIPLPHQTMVFFSKLDPFFFAAIALGTWYIHGYIKERRENPNNLPLPPGPKGLPIIGSLSSFPRYKPWLEYDKWFKKYGESVSFSI
jgi:hypothetical protein